MNQLAQDLRAAKALIDTPEKWGQDKNGVRFPRSQCHCIVTATVRTAKLNTSDIYNALGFEEVSDVVRWNDAPERSHAEVMAAFDKAIEKAEAGNA